MTEHPIKRTFFNNVPARATATDGTAGVFVAPFAGVIESVEYIPDADITGANTNSRTVQLINKGQAGAGTTVAATLAFVSGVNATAFDAKNIPLSGTPANLTVASGDVLAWFSDSIGTGLADGGGLVKIVLAKS
jgi:hypothetical protein